MKFLKHAALFFAGVIIGLFFEPESNFGMKESLLISLLCLVFFVFWRVMFSRISWLLDSIFRFGFFRANVYFFIVLGMVVGMAVQIFFNIELHEVLLGPIVFFLIILVGISVNLRFNKTKTNA